MFWIFLKKEIRIEFRTPAAIAGILLHLVASVLILYLLTDFSRSPLSPAAWNAFFWLLILFIQIHAIGKGFLSESTGLSHYYYSVASPSIIILSKIIYNFIVGFSFALVAYLLVIFLSGIVVYNYPVLLYTLALGAWGMSAAFTLPSAIARGSRNSAILMAIMSFPVIIATLILTAKAGRAALDEFQVLSYSGELLTLFAINVILSSISYILFPYIWKS